MRREIAWLDLDTGYLQVLIVVTNYFFSGFLTGYVGVSNGYHPLSIYV